MRIRQLLIGTLACLLLAPAGSGVARAEESVHVPDPGLRVCLAAHLGHPGDQSFTAAELSGLRTFECYGFDDRTLVRDLTGLERLTGVEKLTLSQQSFTDPTPIAGLRNLRNLDLSNNQISDAAFLAELTNLQSLNLLRSGLTALPDLDALDDLADLELSYNAIADLRLRGLDSLQRLRANESGVGRLIVAELPALAEVELVRNSLAEVPGMGTLPSLGRVDLSDNRISDVSAFGDDVQVIARYQDVTVDAVATVGQPSAVPLRGLGGEVPMVTPDQNTIVANGMLTFGSPGTHRLPFTQNRGASAYSGTLHQKAGPDLPFEKTTSPGFMNTVPAVGTDLVVSMRSWTPTEDSRSYVWYRDGVPVKDGTSDQYRLTGADFGHRFRVAVTVTRDGSISQTVWTKASAKVVAGTFDTGSVSVTGTRKTGQVLTAKVSGWTPTPERCALRWQRNSSSISGATKFTYTLTAADLGKRIRVRATCHARGIYSDTAYSARTAKVTQGPVHSATPTITGTPSVGKKLAVSKGIWGPGTISFGYQWLRDGHAISRATKSTYLLTAADQGHSISVRVRGDRSSYTAVSRTSVAVQIG